MPNDGIVIPLPFTSSVNKELKKEETQGIIPNAFVPVPFFCHHIPAQYQKDFQAYLDAGEENLEITEEWYDVDNGIITFNALLSYMQQTGNKKPRRLARESDLVTAELEDCLKCLTAAKSHGSRFRVDMW